MGQETELKLTFDPEDLRSIRAYTDLSFGTPKVSKLKSVYYDTPDRKLLAKGLSFRVRRSRDGYRQTLKSEDTGRGGVLRREEYECDLSSSRPRPDAFRNGGKSIGLLQEVRGDLKPAFKVEVERASYGVDFPGCGQAVIEIDVGEVKAGRKKSRLHEIEIEAKGAGEADLYRLARQYCETAAVRLSTVTKSQRGFELLTSETALPQKAKKISLNPNGTTEEAFQRVLENGLTQVIANDRCVLETEDPEGVHQMRVALRRLRSAFRTFRPLLPADVARAYTRQLGGFASSLGPARDWDVFHIELVQPACRNFPSHRGLQLLSRRTAGKRLSSREAAISFLSGGSFTSFLLDFRLWVTERHWREQLLTPRASQFFSPAAEFAVSSLAKRHRKVRKLAKASLNGSPEDRHNLRIEIKKLKYTLDFFTTLFPKKSTITFARTLSRLQDDLGHLNDVAVARSLGDLIVDEAHPEDRRALSEAVGFILGWNTSRQSNSERTIRNDIEKVLAAKVPWGV